MIKMRRQKNLKVLLFYKLKIGKNSKLFDLDEIEKFIKDGNKIIQGKFKDLGGTGIII